jgi:sugar-specific transcriptional regulator TrmB
VKEESQVLRDLGLADSQARVYLTLVKLGQAKARDIRRLSKVARQDIYRVLIELQEKGLVEKILATPNEFKPIPLIEAASILLQRKKNEVSKLQDETRKLVETMARLSKEEQKFLEKGYQCVMIPAKKALALRVAETFARTYTSIGLLSTVKRLAVFLSEYGFDGAIKRGVRLRVISEEPEDKQFFERIVPSFFKSSNFELRYMSNSINTAFSCFDGREVYIATNVRAGVNEVPVLWSNNPSIVGLVSDFFEHIWNSALKSRPEKSQASRKAQV